MFYIYFTFNRKKKSHINLYIYINIKLIITKVHFTMVKAKKKIEKINENTSFILSILGIQNNLLWWIFYLNVNTFIIFSLNFYFYCIYIYNICITSFYYLIFSNVYKYIYIYQIDMYVINTFNNLLVSFLNYNLQ